jgi:hypothetical protein
MVLPQQPGMTFDLGGVFGQFGHVHAFLGIVAMVVEFALEDGVTSRRGTPADVAEVFRRQSLSGL